MDGVDISLGACCMWLKTNQTVWALFWSVAFFNTNPLIISPWLLVLVSATAPPVKCVETCFSLSVPPEHESSAPSAVPETWLCFSHFMENTSRSASLSHYSCVYNAKLVWKSCVGKPACLQPHIPRHALWRLKFEWLCVRGISRKRSLPDINEHTIKGSSLNIVLCSKASVAGDYQRCLFVYRPSPGPGLAVFSVHFSRCTWSLRSNALASLICSTASIGVVQRWIIPQSRKRVVPYSVRNEMPLVQKCQLHICKNIHLCWFLLGSGAVKTENEGSVR